MNNTGTFTAVGQQSAILSLAPHESAEIVLTPTGSHSRKIDLVRMTANDSGTQSLVSFTANTGSTTRWLNDSNAVVRLRLQCNMLDSADGETVVYALRDTVPVEAQDLICHSFVVDVNWVDGLVATLPASKTNAVVYVRAFGLHVGDRIVGAYVTGNINGAGAASADLLLSVRFGRAGQTGAAYTELGFMAAPVSSGAGIDLLIDSANTQILLDHTVGAEEVVFATVTCNTGAGCGAELDALVLQYIPAL